MSATPRVLNKRNGMPDGAIYIGRPSKWGNPFQIGRDGDRHDVIRRFTEYFLKSDLIRQIGELRGKDLVCWCAPQACHGDVLLHLANEDDSEHDD